MILYFLVCPYIWSCGSANKLIDMSSEINIEISFDNCIHVDEPNMVRFIINNRTAKTVTIHAWHLYLNTIYSNEGHKLEPHTIIEQVVSEDLEEYIEVSGKSTKEIVISTEFFKTFLLDKDLTYKVIGEYDGSYSSRGNRFKLKSEQVQIKTCPD